jgi:hypothetical protein
MKSKNPKQARENTEPLKLEKRESASANPRLHFFHLFSFCPSRKGRFSQTLYRKKDSFNISDEKAVTILFLVANVFVLIDTKAATSCGRRGLRSTLTHLVFCDSLSTPSL